MASKLLIAAGGTVSSEEELPFGVRGLIEAADKILVVTPALSQERGDRAPLLRVDEQPRLRGLPGARGS